MSSDTMAGSARPKTRLFALAGLCLLIAVALSMVLNGCGGSSPNSATAPSQPTQPSGPSVALVSSTPCSSLPNGSEFFSSPTNPSTCQSATIMNCPNAANLNLIYSYDAPPSPKGTIVFFSGGPGTAVDLGDINNATYYFSQGYEVIQVEWADDWELTTIPAANGGSDTTTYTANIQLAACRNATLLNYIFTGGNTKLYSGGGRCAQGSSAGSAAIAYALTFYGAGNYLDAVELISGPPLANIYQGCAEPPPTPSLQVCPIGQAGCQLGGASPWTLSPQYQVTSLDPGAAPGVRKWTGDNSCNQLGTTTSSTSNQAWLQESIVNDGTNNPVYSYPTTAMSAWLCASVNQSGVTACTRSIASDGGQGGVPQDSCPNNASSQAQFYYAKVASNNPQAAYNVYAVENCNGPEGATDLNSSVPALNNLDGRDAVQHDMVNRCVRP